jgi:hypothetical protein
MNSLRRQQIEKRADSLTQMQEIPAQMAAKIPAHYIKDVPVLLLQIKKHKANEAQFVEMCSEMNSTIEQLRNKNKALKNQLRKNAEKYDLNKEIFSDPPDPVVAEPSNKNRITENNNLHYKKDHRLF